MTRKKFILAGVFLIALGALSIALQSYLMVSEIISKEMAIYGPMFYLIAIPLAFGLLLWRRLKYTYRSRRLSTFCCAGFFVAFFISLLFPIQYVLMMSGFDPSGPIVNEIVAWSKSGGEGDFHSTTKAKVEMAFMIAFVHTLGNWPVFVALYFGSKDSSSPRGNNLLDRLSKRISEKRNAVTSSRKQIVS